MFGLFKKIFIELLIKKCKTQPTHINLHPNKYTQGLRYCLFTANIDRCVWSYRTLNDLFNKVCVPNKTEDLNLRQDDYKSKWIKNINKVYIIRM